MYLIIKRGTKDHIQGQTQTCNLLVFMLTATSSLAIAMLIMIYKHDLFYMDILCFFGLN